MKKTFLAAMLLLMTRLAFGQITLENTYSHSGTYTQMAVSGSKFYIMDLTLNQCRIYNTDHSLWKTINLAVPANNYLYDVKYVSENLFTTDNAICLLYTYYIYDTINYYYTYTTKVIKENGTVLLTVPGCLYAYVNNIPAGTKLVTYSYDYSQYPVPIQTAVYALPGVLNATLPAQAEGEGLAFAYPNPGSELINIPVNRSGKAPFSEVIITDMSGRVIRSIQVSDDRQWLSLPTAGFASGTYFYSVRSGNSQTAASKIVVR